MAVSVTFYRCPKTLNSTRVPAAAEAALTCDCNIRDGSGVLRPVLELVLAQNSSTIATVNMAYISMFSRYYWIDEIKYINRKWVVSMHVDVLSTYKTEIGAASRFILRAASENDPTIIDDFTIRKCLQKTSVTLTTTGLISPTNLSQGVFIIGVVGRDTAPGMVTYYALTVQQMSVFRRYLLSIGEDDTASDWETFGGDGTDVGSLTPGVIKSFVDPFQYIVSCMWFPIPSFSGGTESTIKFGFWESALIGNALGTSVIETITRTITTPTRDDENTTMPGMYCKAEPFAELELYYPPFESIKIPASQAAFTSIRTVLVIDLVTGMGLLQVYAGATGDNLIAQSTAMIGVPFQIAQITTDYFGAANQGFVSSITKIPYSIGHFISSKLFGQKADDAVAGSATGVLSAYLSEGKISGTSGGFAPLAVGVIAKLYLRYTDVTEPDIVNVGRPLCKVRTINTLSGYVQCQTGRILCPGTEEELNEIEGYMEGGFYYD